MSNSFYSGVGKIGHSEPLEDCQTVVTTVGGSDKVDRVEKVQSQESDRDSGNEVRNESEEHLQLAVQQTEIRGYEVANMTQHMPHHLSLDNKQVKPASEFVLLY